FITAAFNNVATLYNNEQITTSVSQVHVWTTQDSYPTNSSSNALNSFKATRTSFNGDLAHLAALGGSNLGGIAWVDVLCNNAYRYAYSNIYSSYSTVPTYSWTVYVMTHEMGHNLGSPHTQSCSWTGGALDNCYTTEGGCAPGPAPTNGGTIMSYCHLTSNGINFNNGFGTQPGNLIRNRVNAASCLSTCSNPGCSQPNNLTLKIVVDNYPGETTWNLKNSSNAIVASGGPYSGTPSGSTVNVPICIPNGCYTLTFLDSYGDGICCSYGNGSYTLLNASNATIVSGGQFTSQDVKTFCLNPVVTYCGSAGSNSSMEFINRVQLNAINNQSGNNNGYANYTSLSTTLTPGSSYTATLTPGFSGGSYNEYWRVWIDYNKDGDFTDANEQVLALSGSAAVSGSFTVPAGVTGTTRMRVSMKYGSASTSCEAFTYGEVEDYTIVLGSPTPGMTGPLGETGAPLSYTVQERTRGFVLYPNPAKSELTLSWFAEGADDARITITDLAGRRISDYTVTGRPGNNILDISVSELAPGNYLVQLQTGPQQFQQKLLIQR
ncbi:MAG: T9SS type A sorting domain-containing protein, partial [Sphingobacteriales bacterium]